MTSSTVLSTTELGGIDETHPGVPSTSDIIRPNGLNEDIAARKIQKAWRHRGRVRFTVEGRWEEVVDHTRLNKERRAAIEGKNDVQSRWHRTAYWAAMLRDGNKAFELPGMDEKGIRKEMETQHWLELTDSKHRYGSNLKYFHRRWQAEQTEDNFFKWLDHGSGKDLSFPECSREQLEIQRIVYLSKEQRLNYLVKVGSDGLLRWDRNNVLVDTTAGCWKDSGSGMGIVPCDDVVVQHIPRRTSFEDGGPVSPVKPLASTNAEDGATLAHHESSHASSPIKRIFDSNFTPLGLMNKFLRKTVKKPDWIYVSDNNFNMFMGIKDTGTFQHSSLISGGLVTSAGLISVHNGRIHKLSPLSGHYRTSIEHFRQFLDVLDDKGADLSRAQIKRAEVSLWGVEHINAFKKRKGRTFDQQKATEKDLSGKPPTSGSDASNDDDRSDNTHWRRDILQGRKKSLS